MIHNSTDWIGPAVHIKCHHTSQTDHLISSLFCFHASSGQAVLKDRASPMQDMRGLDRKINISGHPCTHCPRCKWRHSVLPPDPNEADSDRSSSWHEDAEYEEQCRSRILKCHHSVIPSPWIAILNTNVFYGPSIRALEGLVWIRLPVRAECPLRLPKRAGWRHFEVDDIWYPPGHIYQGVFHHTKIGNLLQGNEYAPNSRGILQQGLCFGTRTHNGNSGVNFFSKIGKYGMWQSHVRRNDMVALELNVTTSTKLSGGSIGRYCINRGNLAPEEQNQHRCPFAGVEALWVLRHHVPDFVILS